MFSLLLSVDGFLRSQRIQRHDPSPNLVSNLPHFLQCFLLFFIDCFPPLGNILFKSAHLGAFFVLS